MILFEASEKSARQVKPLVSRNGKRIVERDIQNIFEGSLHEILGVNFVASEYVTSFGGRMDTLGIDDDGNPCIIEYKKGQNENVWAFLICAGCLIIRTAFSSLPR